MEPRVVLAADPFISELLALNNNSLTDNDGDSSDWIEIANPSDEAIELGGWYLTDDADTLTKWRFPGTRIGAGEHLIVFASGKDLKRSATELHTNFRLSGDGEFLALVKPDGLTIASQFRPAFPPQFDDVSYGQLQTKSVTTLVSEGNTAHYLVPDAHDASQIGSTWTGGHEPFDDSPSAGWSSGPLALGFEVPMADDRIEGTVSLAVSRGTPGNQAFGGRLGSDFTVHRPIQVTALGAFDHQSDGLSRLITVELWQRGDGGTSGVAEDDRGVAILASHQFSPRNPGMLIGGSRFKPLLEPVLLPPGQYTIVASGYGEDELNGNSGGDRAFGMVAIGSAVEFAGAARFGASRADTFPTFVDTGPATRYGAGTFVFVEPGSAARLGPSGASTHVAYQTRPGVGNATFEGNLGMDFEVLKPIRITELGVFDSGQDGISGTVAVSLWSLTGQSGRRLASQTFFGQAGGVEPGTGSRFLPLAEPIVLPTGSYSIVASGFLGEDRFSRADADNPLQGELDSGAGALEFIGSSRASFFGRHDRFREWPHHRLPERLDHGPVNKWAAGTFKFETVIGSLIATDVQSQLHRVNTTAYVRVPFHVPVPAAFDGLRLAVSFHGGFVAYINGTEVARENAPPVLLWNSRSLELGTGQYVSKPRSFDVSEHLDLLRPGANILAVHALTSGLDDPTFLVQPELEASQVTGLVTRYFDIPTPGDPNSGGFIGTVEDTKFSVDRGFVTESMLNATGQLLVEIATQTEGARIFYTLDGSQPTPEAGALYTEALTLVETTILRAAAFKDGFLPSNVDTQTYIFIDDVLTQTALQEGLPPHWNGAPADYGISQDPEDLARIAGDPSLAESQYNEAIKESLLSLPTLSIVLDPDELFGPVSGLYSNPYPRGLDWERPASVELIMPDGSDGFQIDAGLRMMGWTSRVPTVSPKHSLRIAFRGQYGAGRLDYPFFGDMGVDSFDTITLRSNSRDAWISDYPLGQDDEHPLGAGRAAATYLRDQWSKEVQRDMGRPTVTGNFVHLYLNGLYWGVYNPTERPDASFAADHFGGSPEEYDSVTFCNPTTRATDGNLAKWNELISRADAGLANRASYQRIQGNNPDGTRNPEFEVLIDIDNFIDYMIAGQFDAADDWPCNFYAIRRRGAESQGFQFITWDNDLAIPMIQNDRGKPIADVNASRIDIDLSVPLNSSPWRMEAALRQNEEYRIRYADAVQRHLFNGGALTPAANIARWTQIAAQIEPALIAESARWGDYRRDIDPVGQSELYTREEHWRPFFDDVVNNYFPARSEVFLDELRSKGLFPDLDAPSFNQHGGEVDAGFLLEISAPYGQIWYTRDGSDPRLTGGQINPLAVRFTGPVSLGETVQIQARVLEGDQWSAMNGGLFQVRASQGAEDLLPGDANGDNVVDQLDLVIVQANLGTAGSKTRAEGDLDGDRMVTRLDLVALLQNYGRTRAPLAPGAAAVFAAMLGHAAPSQQTIDTALADLDYDLQE
jgi:hypothetical protein